jgi:hypothetical protein
MWAYKKLRLSAPILQFNTHLDPVDWRHNRGFIGVPVAIAQIHQHLYARRTGFRDPAEPTGLLTHHLVQHNTVWKFCYELLQHLTAHPAVAFTAASTMWPSTID